MKGPMMRKEKRADRDAAPTRRQFIRQAAGAALTASTALSYARIPGANERVRTGFIGVGNRGESLLRMVLKDCPQARVAAVCDVYQPYLDHAGSLLDADARADGDYRRLLDDKELDAVVIASPDHWHARQLVDACRAGKDVYVEKPFSLTVAEGRKMVEVARETGRIVQMGAQRHSSPYIVEACRRMREGAIGKITFVRCFHATNEYPMGIGRMEPSDPPHGLNWDLWLGPAPWRPYAEILMALGQDAPLSVAALGGRFAVEDDRDIPEGASRHCYAAW